MGIEVGLLLTIWVLSAESRPVIYKLGCGSITAESIITSDLDE